MSIKTFLPIVALGLSVSACTNVEPWDREYLALDHMAIDPYPGDVRALEHANFSREGTSGGFDSGAGGCGCN